MTGTTTQIGTASTTLPSIRLYFQPTCILSLPPTQFYSSGIQLVNNMIAQDILQEGTVVLDGTERLNTKNVNFFRLIQNYKFSSGDTSMLPGINLYSFSLDPNTITQPSGTVNGSMFNRTNLQYTLLVPPTVTSTVDSSGNIVPVSSPAPICIVKGTEFNPVPTLSSLRCNSISGSGHSSSPAGGADPHNCSAKYTVQSTVRGLLVNNLH